MTFDTTRTLLLIQMASDQRVPACAMGYLANLQAVSVSPAVQADSLAQLARYIPDLVARWV